MNTITIFVVVSDESAGETDGGGWLSEIQMVVLRKMEEELLLAV